MPSTENMYLIDANVILRYLLNDHPVMSAKAKEIVDSGSFTKTEIIAEVVYVLSGVYSVSRSDIRDYIQQALIDIHCNDTAVIIFALKVFAETSLDFVDCLLVAYHNIAGNKVYTFDKKLNRKLNESAED